MGNEALHLMFHSLSLFMKYKHLIAVFIIGIMLWFFGAWAKITQQSYAANTVDAAIAVVLLSGVLALIKILFSKSDDSFLNK